MTKRTAEPVQVEDLTKTFGDVQALDHVGLAAKAGEFVAILGPSGSGKSTLLMAVGGFIRPDSGRIIFGGRDIIRIPANKRGFGIVFQSYALFPHMDVEANIAFPLLVRGTAPEEARMRVKQALDVVQLGGYGARRIGELSGGQRQRVALARAIVFEPKVLLMDEPLSALDKALREEMQIEIRELHNSLGITTLYVTHDQREALTIADRVAVMDHGRLLQFDDPETIYRHPANEFVARFIGEAVILPLDGMDGIVTGDLGNVDRSMRSVMVRGEDLCLAADGGPGAWLTLCGTLRGIVFQGDSWLLQVDLADGRPITARAQRYFSEHVSKLEVGCHTKLHVRRDRVHFLA